LEAHGKHVGSRHNCLPHLLYIVSHIVGCRPALLWLHMSHICSTYPVIQTDIGRVAASVQCIVLQSTDRKNREVVSV
jgi:hypothetical protein